MVYYGIKDKKTGQLLRQFFKPEGKKDISVLSLNDVPGSLSSHIFLTKDRNVVMSALLNEYYECGNEAFKLADGNEDLEIYETEFNL